MFSPFPGMDPYLEESRYWRQVHTALIIDIQRYLAHQLQPHYFIEIEQRTYLAVIPPEDTGIPDVVVIDAYHYPQGNVMVSTPQFVMRPVTAALPMPSPEQVTERYLQIRAVDSQEIITVIEILSPTNKTGGIGREEYLAKRTKVLKTKTHLVEIDLLRSGHPMPMSIGHQSDYRLVVSRSQNRPQADIYFFSVRDPIPDLPIPLRPTETEPTLPLNQILHNLYDLARYDLSLNYRHLPNPPLKAADEAWANELIHHHLHKTPPTPSA